MYIVRNGVSNVFPLNILTYFNFLIISIICTEYAVFLMQNYIKKAGITRPEKRKGILVGAVLLIWLLLFE